MEKVAIMLLAISAAYVLSIDRKEIKEYKKRMYVSRFGCTVCGHEWIDVHQDFSVPCPHCHFNAEVLV